MERNDNYKLKNKRVLITGATSGIGKSLCELFLENESLVIAHGRTDYEIKRISYLNMNACTTVIADLEKRSEWKALEKAIEFNNPNILVLNAGYNCGKKKVSQWTDEEILSMYDVNLISNVFLIRAFSKYNLENKDKTIVIILSTSCFAPRADMSLYNSCKFGLLGYGKTLQQEGLDIGIKTILFYPGKVNSSFREIPNESYMSCDSVAQTILSVLSLPRDILPCEFVFKPETDLS